VGCLRPSRVWRVSVSCLRRECEENGLQSASTFAPGSTQRWRLDLDPCPNRLRLRTIKRATGNPAIQINAFTGRGSARLGSYRGSPLSGRGSSRTAKTASGRPSNPSHSDRTVAQDSRASLARRLVYALPSFLPRSAPAVLPFFCSTRTVQRTSRSGRAGQLFRLARRPATRSTLPPTRPLQAPAERSPSRSSPRPPPQFGFHPPARTGKKRTSSSFV